jgi:hypothetical protein
MIRKDWVSAIRLGKARLIYIGLSSIFHMVSFDLVIPDSYFENANSVRTIQALTTIARRSN